MAVAMIFDYGLERIACAGGQRRFHYGPKAVRRKISDYC
jgi:hypothetical protein